MNPEPEPLRLDSIECRAAKLRILDGIRLNVTQGEFVGILGPNGAGKSTLLAILNATRQPDRGKVFLFNQDPWALNEKGRAALRTRVAMVLQRNEYSRLAPLTASDVVLTGLLGARGLFGRITPGDQTRIKEVMALLGVEQLARRAYRSLSGGEQQKTQLARALAQQPEVLLLDEPTTGLDPDWQERLVAIIDALADSLKLTVLMTTHTPGHLPPCCKRVVLMERGRILHDGPAAEALSPERLGELYGCSVSVVEQDGRRHCLPAGVRR
jgi:ABC-type cobalamin/Fe3+-siderophores transport system ATPase subunit